MPLGPVGRGLVVEVGEAGSDVELGVQDRVPDRQRPQHAGLLGVRVVVGQRADLAGRLDQRDRVVEVGQRDGRRTHQRAVAGGVTGPGVQVVRRRGHRRAGRVGADGAEDGAGLVADVGRAGVVPVAEVAGDLRERLLGAQVGAGGGDVEDGPGHRGVVGPLAGREAAEAAADHAGTFGSDRGQAELVRRAEGVADGGAEHGAAGTVELCGSQLHSGHLRAGAVGQVVAGGRHGLEEEVEHRVQVAGHEREAGQDERLPDGPVAQGPPDPRGCRG